MSFRVRLLAPSLCSFCLGPLLVVVPILVVDFADAAYISTMITMYVFCFLAKTIHTHYVWLVVLVCTCRIQMGKPWRFVAISKLWTLLIYSFHSTVPLLVCRARGTYCSLSSEVCWYKWLLSKGLEEANVPQYQYLPVISTTVSQLPSSKPVSWIAAQV